MTKKIQALPRRIIRHAFLVKMIKIVGTFKLNQTILLVDTIAQMKEYNLVASPNSAVTLY